MFDTLEKKTHIYIIMKTHYMIAEISPNYKKKRIMVLVH